jgi:UDP-GlcNAc:undecaprenyl-phosphate GlcNAc-1-phosphate transferase
MTADLWLAFLVAFGVSLLLTFIVERLAPRIGAVARPAADRWHRGTVPLMGGIAIVIGTLAPILVFSRANRSLTVLCVAALAMAAIGLADDLRSLSPQLKLLAQIILVGGLLTFGFTLRLTGYKFVDTFITLLWVVGITNAFNLLDNMDGLSTSIAIVAVGFRLFFFQWEGETEGARICAVFMGALTGFLVRNFPPAKIFMGDTGSLFLGFFLSGLSIVTTERAYSRGVAAVLVIPVLLLLIPVFDTAFVTATRLLAGRSIAVGGRDHTSHRLVAIGLSERQTVLLLAALSAAAGGVAVVSYRAGLSQTVVLLALLVLLMVLLGIYLSRVHVVHRVEAPVKGAVFQLLADFMYKRQVMTLVLDTGLILIAYYGAYVIRFEQALPQQLDQVYASLPRVLVIQLVTFGAFGLYRGIWQYTGIADMLRIVKAVTVGIVLTLVMLVYTQIAFSRSVLILDWLLLVVLLGGSRASFRFFAEMFRPAPKSFQRVLIYGAGDGGELIVREMRNNPALERVPIGFVDDDRNKRQTRIHGLPVFGSGEDVEAVIRERGITEVIVASAKIRGNELEHVKEVCARLDLPVRRASVRLE